jgi:hypothetical protein
MLCVIALHIPLIHQSLHRSLICFINAGWNSSLSPLSNVVEKNDAKEDSMRRTNAYKDSLLKRGSSGRSKNLREGFLKSDGLESAEHLSVRVNKSGDKSDQNLPRTKSDQSILRQDRTFVDALDAAVR